MSSTSSKRQRFFDIVKAAKDVYIPTIQSTITQLASEATQKAITYTEPRQRSPNQQDGEPPYQPEYNQDIRGARIVIYPHFTRTTDDGYFTQVHGLLYSTEGGSRKKKFFLGVARQLAKPAKNGVETISSGQFDEKLTTLDNSVAGLPADSDSTYSGEVDANLTSNGIHRPPTSASLDSDDSSTHSSVFSDSEEILKERLSAFFHKSLGNTELTVAIGGSNREEVEIIHILTDASGNFNTDVRTNFKPTFIQVAITIDEKVFAVKETIFPGNSQFGIISDIDDTIKNTGVCGDKRSLFRNCFSDDISTWEVPGAAECYNNFSTNFNMSLFYVSNSPYQLYANISQFFEAFEFPKGSMYLKKYSGNLFGAMWEPSHSRKRAALERIIKHFQNKKFFLIGDSGEQDLEAFVDLSRSYPDNVAGIFIRCADFSMSQDTYNQIEDILNKKNPQKQHRIMQYHNDHGDLIDLHSNIEDEVENYEFTSNCILSKEHLMNLEAESEKKSGEVLLNDQLSLERGDSSFFPETKKLERSPSTTTQAPVLPRRKPPPSIPHKPDHLRQAPVVPKKLEFLKAHQTKPLCNESNKTFNFNIEDSVQSQNPPAMKSPADSAPPLPQRPIPTPPPRPKPKTGNNSVSLRSQLYQQKSLKTGSLPSSSEGPVNADKIKMLQFNEEKNDDWLSRVMTSVIVLSRSKAINSERGIKLKFFKSFDEVEKGIYEVLNDEYDEDLLDSL